MIGGGHSLAVVSGGCHSLVVVNGGSFASGSDYGGHSLAVVIGGGHSLAVVNGVVIRYSYTILSTMINTAQNLCVTCVKQM